MVDKLSSGEIGYLHIRQMNEPSLRQFENDLAAQGRKKALIIDQRFNPGGGIDQELLEILAAEAVPVHAAAGFGRGDAAAARLLRPDGRDGERALDVGRRGVPRRLQDAEARQGRRRDDLRRRDRHRCVLRSWTARRSARRAPACGT